MTTITLQDIKSRGAKAIRDDRVTYLIVNSKPKSVMVPVELYEAMMETIEDWEDLRVMEERKNDPLIPFDEFFSKL